ncbi:hypothetical protein FHW78_001360 [Pseudoxanthomonas sp. OG2]|jgi:hypothetical protein|nr:hypothetical protein [Pseudoxanthomonas sp. OG2]MBD9377148.1 DUF4124 domain-containing protein [Pseudoxanthomonas sp. PXM04]MBV7473350.1 DUF4124 domain-containing protein [Pseudoxanthomonas sp. PXM05]
MLQSGSCRFRLEPTVRAPPRPSTALPLLALATLVVASLPALAGPVYQWKDAKGVTHYSDKPPTDRQYQDRRIAPRGEPVPQADAAAGKSVEHPQCTTARKNLEILGSSGPVAQAGEDGKPGQAMDDTQRANQLALAQAAEKAYCAPPAK